MLRRVILVGMMAVLAAGLCCGPASAAVWLSDNFDSYSGGNLVGQGGWTGTAGPTRVETTFVKSGKTVEANYLAWGAGDASRSVSSGGGYHYIEFDAAMDVESTMVSQNLGYLMVFSSTGTELMRVYFAYQEFKVLLAPATRYVIQGSVVARQWYHIKVGIDLTARKVDAWVDGIRVLTQGELYGWGTSIGTITFGQWANLTSFTKSEMYIDNLTGYSGSSPALSTLLLYGTDSSGWERKNLFHPYVIYDSTAANYKMYYCAAGQCEESDGAWDLWRTGLATSTDTVNWTRKLDDSEPILYPTKFFQGDLIDPDVQKLRFDSMFAYNPCVIKDGSTYKMWYTGWNGESEHIGGGVENKINYRIGLATSTDMIAWTKQPGSAGCGSVFGLGSAGAQDAKGVGDPAVIKEGSTYRMWYEGFDGSIWRIFYATSSDGVTWARQGIALTTGGSGALDQLGVRCPVVISRNGHYELWYQGKSSSSPNYHIMRATSADGVTWAKVAGEVTFHPIGSTLGSEQIRVDSILVLPDNSCQAFYTRENITNYAASFGTVLDHRFSIYSETVAP